ncbi:MAG: leucine-rich repeat domain-containing protein [Candidatus Gracilibacteria bacterium]|nr:leucine-rich repeat domain-containing protein [Candidatus Gracilibacteria bacterium]
MKKNKNAFNIVELIVVITILSILGTIAFINLQGYGVGARDGKRVSDITNILKKIGVEEIKGADVLSYIDNQSSKPLVINNIPTTGIQGTPNFIELKEDGDEIKDPTTKGDYLLSYSQGLTSTGIYKFTQIATVNEEKNTAVVKGNYHQMMIGDSPSIIKNNNNFVVNGGLDLPYIVNTEVQNNNLPEQIGNSEFDNYDGTLIIIQENTDTNFDYGNTDTYLYSVLLEDNTTLYFNYQTYGGEYYIDMHGFGYNDYYYVGIEPLDVTPLGTYYDGSVEMIAINMGELGIYIKYKYLGSPLVDGECGYDHLQALFNEPTNLCYAGIGSSVTDTGLGYTWTCDGVGGGNQASCEAEKKVCDYQQADIDILNTLGINGDLDVKDFSYSNIDFPATKDEWCNAFYMNWYGGANLAPEIFTLKYLENLNAPNNSIVNIPQEIGNLTNLKYIFLRSNSITSLPTTFGNLTKLQTLYIEGNQLSTLPTTFGNLTNLISLYLDSNPLVSIPQEFGNLINLRILYLRNNNLTDLPIEFGNLDNLETLHFGANQLNFIPDGILALKNIKYLGLLDATKLVNVPAEIGNMTSLISLDFRWNSSLSTLPPEIGNLVNLEYLYFGNTSIPSLPSEIGNLSNLKSLRLYNTKVTVLPSTIGNLQNLNTLDSQGSKLSSLPEELKNITTLNYLNLEGSIGLGELNFSFNKNSSNKSQSGVPAVGKTMTIGGNGTNVVISVTP